MPLSLIKSFSSSNPSQWKVNNLATKAMLMMIILLALGPNQRTTKCWKKQTRARNDRRNIEITGKKVTIGLA